MPEVNPPNPEQEIIALKKEVATLKNENLTLKTQLATAEAKATHFQKMYFKAARLGERITSSKPPPPPPTNN